MKRVLLTGMSGTGKSTLIAELAERGYKSVDLDEPGWSEYNTAGDWAWREDRVEELLNVEDSEILFVSGCSESQIRFYPLFDHVILLSAPAEILVERLMTRTTNQYGKRPEELADVLHYLETVEPLLRRTASHEIDANAPLGAVLAAVLSVVQPSK